MADTNDAAMDKVRALRAKMALQREQADALKEYFTDLFPDNRYPVPDTQFGIWIRQYGFDYAVDAFEDIAKKVNTLDNKKIFKVVETSGKSGKPVPVEQFNTVSLIKLASWIMGQAKKKAESGA